MEWVKATTTPQEGDEGASDDVLVQMSDGTMDVAFYDYAEEAWFFRCGFLAEGQYTKITHWRPLPEGPKD
jgi:hypothetical protein